VNTKERLEGMKRIDAANAQHIEDRPRSIILPATPERVAIWEACEANAAEHCKGCPYRYKCEEPFPEDTPWGRGTIPTDYKREGDYFVIREETE